ncbi:MAG: tetratricopeptide repeat protein [Phycisphaerae bacterium]
MPNREELLDEIRDLALAAAKDDRDPIAVELLHKYLQHRPADGYMWFRLGEALRVIGLNNEAEHALNTALELAPEKRPWILAQYGKLCADAGRRAEAELAYAEACQHPETSGRGWLWIMRGANLAADTQLSPAEKCHRHALTFHDEYVDRDEAFLNLGYVLRAQGRYAEASDAFKSALAITPDDTDAAEALHSLDGIKEALAKAKELSD